MNFYRIIKKFIVLNLDGVRCNFCDFIIYKAELIYNTLYIVHRPLLNFAHISLANLQLENHIFLFSFLFFPLTYKKTFSFRSLHRNDKLTTRPIIDLVITKTYNLLPPLKTLRHQRKCVSSSYKTKNPQATKAKNKK